MKCNQWIEGTIEPHGLPYCRCGGDIPSPWRDVREELPDIIGHYLVCTAIGAVREIAWAFFSYDKRWIVDSKFVNTVAHWMHLPAPPSGKE